jgi:hypothetical protein
MLLKRILVLAGAIVLAVAWGGQSAKAQAAFTVASSSFKDGERLPTKMAGNNKQNPNCPAGPAESGDASLSFWIAPAISCRTEVCYRMDAYSNASALP